MEKLLLICVILLITGLLAFAIQGFVIGEPVDGTQLLCTAALEEDVLHVRADATESAMALRGWEHWQEGTQLHIRGWKVPVSPLFRSGSYEAQVDVTGIDRVYLGGRLIWQR